MAELYDLRSDTLEPSPENHARNPSPLGKAFAARMDLATSPCGAEMGF